MRLFGHPVHVMLVHFPIALWPAHLALHLAGRLLPVNVSAVAGFWLLAAGVVTGWFAAALGALDLAGLAREPGSRRLKAGLVHGATNGTALLGFTAIAALEYVRYPRIEHGAGFHAIEALLVLLLFAGNYFGGVARGDVPDASDRA